LDGFGERVMSTRQLHIACVIFFMLAGYSQADDAAFTPPPIHVPDGFTLELAAAPPLVSHPMMANFDDRGRLFIAESAGKNLRRGNWKSSFRISSA